MASFERNALPFEQADATGGPASHPRMRKLVGAVHQMQVDLARHCRLPMIGGARVENEADKDVGADAPARGKGSWSARLFLRPCGSFLGAVAWCPSIEESKG